MTVENKKSESRLRRYGQSHILPDLRPSMPCERGVFLFILLLYSPE